MKIFLSLSHRCNHVAHLLHWITFVCELCDLFVLPFSSIIHVIHWLGNASLALAGLCWALYSGH
jgi:hypothetical protein